MKTFGQLKAEIQTVVRVCHVAEGVVIEELIGWIDHHYHGVVELPFDGGNEMMPVEDQPEGRGLEE